ncbi:MAG: FAD-binding oxidoreductase [Pseudonocardia sp.]|nr:FAD-binding oxidoreductase [Pseudonocardia sp.]
MTSEVTVLGAGVIGLSCATVLAESGARVRIVTADPSEATTSAAATGMAGPVIPGGDERAQRWELATVAHLRALAGSAGVRMATGLVAAPAGTGAPPLVDDSLVRTARPDELPAGFAFGMWLTVPLVDVPVYLGHLLARFTAAGGEIEPHRVTELEAAGDAPVLVNCSGLGARELCGDTDVHPVKGQQVVLANPGLDGFFMPAPGPAEWASWHAHGDHVLLGGVRHAHDADPAPSPATAAGILERCAALEPRLAGARVLGHRAGLRPERSRVRLETEQRGALRVVHCYGHGGTGVLQSWGCALDVAALVGSADRVSR